MNRQLFNILLANQLVDKNLLKLDSREVVNFGAQSNTTKRSFTGKGIIKGFAYSNWYVPSHVTSFEKYKNGFKFSSKEGYYHYGVGFDIKAVPNATYLVYYDGIRNNLAYMSEYDKDGNFIRASFTSGWEGNSRKLTTVENTEWIVISFQNKAEDGVNVVEYNNVSITLME